MSQHEIVGRADNLYSTYTALQVNTDGSINVNSTDPARNVVVLIATLTVAAPNSPVFDLTGARRVRIYGNTGPQSFLMLQYASSSSFQDTGTYDFQNIDSLNPLLLEGNNIVNKVIEVPPNFLRIVNPSGADYGISFRIIIEK